MPRAFRGVAAVALLLLYCCVQGNPLDIECRHDNVIPRVPGSRGRLQRSALSGLRLKGGPKRNGHRKHPAKRSITRCSGLVESVFIEESTTSYLGVPIGGIVSIVESVHPWSDSGDAQLTPICSGIFIGDNKILSSAHCVYHQRLDNTDTRFWLFGSNSRRRRYFYAVAGKTSSTDTTVSIYPLQMACVPKSYVAANNETLTSGQMNDFTVMTTLSPFQGDPKSLATFAKKIATWTERREYILPQYPLDVANGAQLVIDVATSPLYRTTYFGGVFFSIDLVSWIGSSGGPIIDVKKSVKQQRPVLTGILMSEGWQVCDSGMLPITGDNELFKRLRSKKPHRSVEFTKPNTPRELSTMKSREQSTTVSLGSKSSHKQGKVALHSSAAGTKGISSESDTGNLRAGAPSMVSNSNSIQSKIVLSGATVVASSEEILGLSTASDDHLDPSSAPSVTSLETSPSPAEDSAVEKNFEESSVRLC